MKRSAVAAVIRNNFTISLFREKSSGFAKSFRRFRERQFRLDRCGGFETLPVDSLKCKIPKYFENSEKAVVFHNPGKKAIIGFREEENYFIIALDRNFTAYNHGK